tara:strand:- start:587 stop:706 length:120 start_codon:yes stop_codon:yes gene_type:complete
VEVQVVQLAVVVTEVAAEALVDLENLEHLYKHQLIQQAL